MTEFFINTFIILFVVIDPIGVAPIFGALTRGGTAQYQRQMARRSTFFSALILMIFGFTGHLLLHALGISLDAFRIAGGLFLLLLSIEMVTVRQSGLRSTIDREQVEAESKEDISVFPLAVPLLAGPGAITTLLLLVGENQTEPLRIVVVAGVLFLVLALVFIAFIFAGRLMQWIGETGANVVSRLLGILLSALAVQYIIDGIRGSFFTAA